MILGYEEIKSITFGAERITEENGYFRFARDTEEQFACRIKHRNEAHVTRAKGTSGVRFSFATDSETFAFDYTMDSGSSRDYGYFDIWVNGVMCHHIGRENGNYSDTVRINLPCGEVHVEVYFPWSKAASVSNVSLGDGAYVRPVKRSRKLMCCGDSITQGYDARFPSLSYASALSRYLDADILNKAIGGDVFFPEYLASDEPYDPDIITVAYGINDWNTMEKSRVAENCRKYYSLLSSKFPKAVIYAVSPIWYRDYSKPTAFGAEPQSVDTLIRELTADLPNVKVITGWNLVPHCEHFYQDRVCHPNDLGFTEYARNLYEEISRA